MDSFVNNAKGLVGIGRDGLIILILLLLFLAPVHMNQALARAGFVKGSIAGFDWESTVKDNNAQLADAGKTISSLQQQLTTTQNALKESEDARKTLAAQVTQTMPGSAAANTAASTPAPPTVQILQQNSRILQDSAIGKSNLRERIQANDNLLATVKRAGQ